MTVRRYTYSLSEQSGPLTSVACIQIDANNAIEAYFDNKLIHETSAVFDTKRLEVNVSEALVALIRRDGRISGDLSRWELQTLCVTDAGEMN